MTQVRVWRMVTTWTPPFRVPKVRWEHVWAQRDLSETERALESELGVLYTLVEGLSRSAFYRPEGRTR